jgi:hypothetical protein
MSDKKDIEIEFRKGQVQRLLKYKADADKLNRRLIKQNETLYKQLKHIYDSYSDEWTFHNTEETAKVLHDYETT